MFFEPCSLFTVAFCCLFVCSGSSYIVVCAKLEESLIGIIFTIPVHISLMAVDNTQLLV